MRAIKSICLFRPFTAIRLVALWALFGLPQALLADERIPTSERNALLAIFGSTHGEHWKHTDGWISPVTGRAGEPGTECDWFGVNCDQGHVTAIHLSDAGLQGTIPETLGTLVRLTTLDLSSNRLTGRLPKSLLRLNRLQDLNLASNRFDGTFPSVGSGGLRSLKMLSLARNHIRGSIGIFLKLTNLIALDIADNEFGGELPNQIGLMHKLQFLSASSNHLVGEIPAEIADLDSLKELFLQRNGLAGRIPRELQNLRRLELLDLSHNHLDGSVPDSLLQLKSIGELLLSHNGLTGPLPITICSRSLRRLDLSWNRLSGTLLGSLSSCKRLSTLNLSHNRLGGSLRRDWFKPLQNLVLVDLSSNRFSGTVPQLDRLENLEYLDLSSNLFNGALPNATWPDLKVLRLDGNKLSGRLPAQVFTKSLAELTLSKNQFSELPPEWCDSSVRVLDLSRNELSGTLCTGEEDLSGLRYFNASYNHFSGSLPPVLLNSDKLTVLLLDHNRLTGSLPERADPSVLQNLDISFNGFTGELPAWLGRMSFLVSVDIRGNTFSAGLQQLTLIKTLRRAEVSENKWTETVPPQLVNLRGAWAPAFDRADIDPEILATEEDTTKPKNARSPSPPAPVVTQATNPDQLTQVVVGTVTDPAGAGIARAKVTAELGTARVETVTDENGGYRLSLAPGSYRLSFSLPGFKEQTIENVSVGAGALVSINVTLGLAQVTETVTVSAEAQAPAGPWWNTWITRRGTRDDATEPTLESGNENENEYTFYLELSAAQKRNIQNGELSTSLEPSLKDRLSKMLAAHVIYTAVLVRVSLLGRAVAFSDKVDSSAEWYSGTWSPHEGASSAIPMRIDLSRLFPYQFSRLGNEVDPSVALRGGGIRFGLKAVKDGCSAVAISIWDETRSVPLDHLVRVVSVGKATRCDGQVDEQETSHHLYSTTSRSVEPDVALQVFNFKWNGTMHSASFMALRTPVDACESYHWNSDAELTGLVLGSNKFRADLADARAKDGVYSSVADQIARAVFPQRRKGNCGSAEAFNALIGLAKDQEVRMFAYISDDSGQLLIAPLGLLAMLDENGNRVFAHDIRLLQPMARETLSETECVGDWTFVLPSALEGMMDSAYLEPPSSLATDKRVMHSRQEFETQFLDVRDSRDSPTGLVVLAHHDDGVLTFSGSGDSVVYTRFEKALGDGSIAVLSACQTTNLTASTKLVDRLNEKGVDGLIAASFPLEVHFGIRFAKNLSDVVAQSSGQTTTLEEVFTKATTLTVKDFEDTTGERARGMGLELVLVGNPKLKICPGVQKQPSPQ